MFPCSLKRFKFKIDLANCHSGLVRLELNNNKKKQRKHGKDATKLGPAGDKSKQAMAAARDRALFVAIRPGPRLELGEIDADIGQYVLDNPAHRARTAG